MSNNEIKINIYNEVGGSAAVSDTDGQKVFEKINKALKAGNSVLLDFVNIDMVISAFLNTAVGQLYKENYSVEFLRSNVKTTNMKKDDWDILATVLKRAKEYYQNPEYREKLDEALKEELDNG
ncbi:TPA: DUF4325 domain-containing protein [Candidatus Gastranaerophilales bacterium HUM_8]|nr:putative uncharacterized protein [Clostridium sp. CAG:967]DAA98946.1 MAG TPA: DUF4325 domain-containing protein [Candidatus Gastranaerophilales bacterium HUM_8]